MNAALAICEFCNGKRKLWNQWAGKEIRCAHCTRRDRTMDSSGLVQITKDEAARREQQAIEAGEPNKYTGLMWTVDLLYRWGKMVRDNGIGYPHMAATEKARIGRGGKDHSTPFTPDLEAVDRAVTKAPVDFKTILVEHYTKFGYVSEKAAHLGISRQTYYQRKASAERHIATEIGA